MKKFLLCSVLIVLAFNTFAVQPAWVAKTLNDVRRAIMIAQKAKTSGKIVLALGKSAKALPDDEIKKLAQIASKPNGLKEVGEILGKANYIEKYGDEAGHLILQDTYLRIALKNEKISEKVATEVFEHLGGTPGLTTLLREINSSSVSQAKGHLRELEIALAAQKRGFSTVSLGQKFADGLKHSDTDLDVLLYNNGKKFAIESKAYSGMVPDSMVKADAESLIAFCKEVDRSVPIFCFETEPSRTALELLSNRGIKCLVGTPDEIAVKLDFLVNL